MQPPRTTSVLLPTALQQRLIRSPARTSLGPVGMLACAVGLWAGLWGASQMTPANSSHTQPPSLILRTSHQPPRLVLALADIPAPRTTTLSPRHQRTLDDIGALFGHVARTLIQDQFDSILLKVSLGQQVVTHLEQNLQP